VHDHDVSMLADCGTEIAFASHFGTFQLTDEAIDTPITALGAACKESNLAADKFLVLKPGQTHEI
jgi:hypothetical protein